MKKGLQIAGLMIAIVIAILVSKGVVFARITGTAPASADIFCVGPSALEVCVDASANIVPTTTAIGSLGTSTLKFNSVNISGAINSSGTITGLAVTAMDAATGTGALANSTARFHLPAISTEAARYTNFWAGDLYTIVSTSPLNAYTTCFATGTIGTQSLESLVFSTAPTSPCRDSKF